MKASSTNYKLSTPDHLRVEWINKIITKLWPHIGVYIKDATEYLAENLKPKLRLEIETLNPGQIAPRVSSVKVREEEERIFIDVSIIYGGDISAFCRWITGVDFEVDHVKIQADVQIELKDFVDYEPFVGTIVVHMDKSPVIDLRFKNMASSLEALKPIKKVLLDYVQNSVKGSFPLTIQLVPDVVDLIEILDDPKNDVNKLPSSSKNKNCSLWDIVSSRPLLDETKPSQIRNLLQERNSDRKKNREAAEEISNNISATHDASSTKSEEFKNQPFPDVDTVDADGISIFPDKPNTQSVDKFRTSSSQAQNLNVDFYLSSPSNLSLISSNTTSQFSVASATSESVEWLSSESEVTVGSMSSEALIYSSSDNLLAQDSQSFLISQDLRLITQEARQDDPISEDMTISEADKDSLRHSFTCPGNIESHSTDESGYVGSSSDIREEKLRAAIARDVEASRGAFLDRILTESEINDEHLKTKEALGPPTSASRESLTRIKDTDQGHGCIELTTRLQTPNTLIVTVHKVRNLPKKVSRVPNPYVKLYLQNQQLKPLRDVATDILEGTQNPVFERSFEFKLDEPLSLYTLRVTAKTKHKLAHQLGQVVLCFARNTSGKAVKERNWYELHDPKKDYVMCWVGYQDPAEDDVQGTDRKDFGVRLSFDSDEFHEQLV